MLVTSYLSARCPVFVAPAMDLDMMSHPTTTRNLATLKADGVHIIEPEVGELASHLVGRGRMEEPQCIAKVLDNFFSPQELSLKGKKVMITAGPTVERIDPVRYISNFSTGKMGFALAEEAARRGAKVALVCGPCGLHCENPAVTKIDVESAREMLEAAEREFKDADIAIMAAAVADYAPAHFRDKKIKREHEDVESIALVKNPDIAATLGKSKRDGQVLVGFALETDNGKVNAEEKLSRKNLDMIVLNSLADARCRIRYGHKQGERILCRQQFGDSRFALKSKAEVAADIFDCIQKL